VSAASIFHRLRSKDLIVEFFANDESLQTSMRLTGSLKSAESSDSVTKCVPHHFPPIVGQSIAVSQARWRYDLIDLFALRLSFPGLAEAVATFIEVIQLLNGPAHNFGNRESLGVSSKRDESVDQLTEDLAAFAPDTRAGRVHGALVAW
jgi:hypothetical protein